MAKIDSLKNKNGDIIYPKTLEKAIYDNDGVRLDNKLNNFVDNSRVLTDVPADAVFTDTKYEAGENIEIVGNTINSLGGGGSSNEVIEVGADGVIDLSLGNIFVSNPIENVEYSIINAGDGYNEFKLYINMGERVVLNFSDFIIINKNDKPELLASDNTFTYNFTTIGGDIWYGNLLYSKKSKLEYPYYYVLAKNIDFSGEVDGEFVYVGSDDYVIIPKKIKGVLLKKTGFTTYQQVVYGLFKDKNVKGVATQNGHRINDMANMFYNSQATTLDLSFFDASNVENMKSMFYNSKATTGYARTQADADEFNASSGKPTGLTFVVKP